MSRDVIFIQGGGVGIDQERSIRRLLAAVGADISFEVMYAGRAAVEQGQPPLPPELIAAVRQRGIALKTKLLPPRDGSQVNYNVQLRRALGLFASVRPVHNLEGLPSRFRGVNFLLVREITEDLYTAAEHEIVPGVVQSLKIVTEAACLRFFRFAFELTRKQGRKTVHCIHKANILKLADGLFLDCFRRVAKEFPDIEPKEMIVDNGCMQLVSRPQQFDVIATGNLYGDLLSDLGAGLVGGISVATGINCGEGITVYEAIHGAGYETVPPDRANPLPAILPALEMLKDLGQAEAAQRIQSAIESVLLEGQVRPADLGGTAGTEAMTDAILAKLG